MESEAHSLREDLYRVIQHYAELTKLAKKGEIDPVSQIGKIVKQTAPFLLLVIRDLLPALERGEITYFEAVYHLIREARKFEDLQVLLDSRQEIQKIEENRRIFIYAVKWLDIQGYQRPLPQDVNATARKLVELNEKYKSRYAPDEIETSTLIPCFFWKQEEAPEQSLSRMAELVRRAILELHHLMVEHEPVKTFLFFDRPTRKEIEDDIMHLVWFLFRSGYSVDRIATGYYKDHIANFLNERVLDYLLETKSNLDTIGGISTHLLILSFLDFLSFFEIPQDFQELGDTKAITKRWKYIRSRNRRGWNLLKKLDELDQAYGAHPQGKLPQGFLSYRYYLAFNGYHGERRVEDPKGPQAVQMYKPLLDPSAMEKKAEEDLKESGRCFSSKTQDEMQGLLKLIMDSLANPKQVKGKKVKVLGDISSGAMGKVSIGIYQNQIVALKKVKTGVASALGDPEELLRYEAAMHRRTQEPTSHPYVVDYFGLVEQDEELLLINGYHPNDNLTQLVERNWAEKFKPPFNVESKITLGVLELIINQLLECLRLFRDRDLVHRDLKTDNILYMVDENERLNRIKVIDFGVALSVGESAIPDLFRGKVVGTFAYMSPEQAKGRTEFQSDLYSAGAIFTVLLTGQLPMTFPRTKTRQELVQQILRIENEPRPRLTDMNPWLTRNTTLEHIAATVESMLDLDPRQRPTIEEAQDAFDGVFEYLGADKHTISIYYDKG